MHNTELYADTSCQEEIETKAAEIMRKGMDCLTKGMGIVEAEEFISIVIQDQFDYTKWQAEFFDGITLEEFNRKAVEYEKEHPFEGNAVIL